ncbi:MAG: hypothetical protein HKN26_16365 [Acidimicrobiales bacterium]|nr:hypothetical protein [Acidimicrobiales bacterium]
MSGRETDRLIEAAFDVPLPTAPGIGELTNRARRRRRVRHSVMALAAVAIVGAGLAGALQLQGDSGLPVATPLVDPVDPPVVDAPPEEIQRVEEWVWVDDIGMTARDGTDTGYVLREFPDATSLVIYLDEGSICLDANTCPASTAGFGLERARQEFIENPDGRGALFDLTGPDNPFSAWHAVFVPNSTHDLYSGQNPSANIPGVTTPQALVGATNLEALVADLTLRLPEVDRVVFAGSGAGGFGVLLNYATVADAYPDIAVTALIDSAFLPLSNDLLPACLLNQVTTAWRRSLPDDWDALVTVPTSQRLGGLYEYASNRYPEASFGLLSTVHDAELRAALGRGTDACTRAEPIPEAVYEAGLRDLDAHFEALPNWEILVVAGTHHGFLRSAERPLTERSQEIVDWIDDLINA